MNKQDSHGEDAGDNESVPQRREESIRGKEKTSDKKTRQILSLKSKNKRENGKKNNKSTFVQKKEEYKEILSLKFREFKDTTRKSLIRAKELLLGKTKKQKRADKPSYVGKKMVSFLFLFIFFSLFIFLHMNLSFDGSSFTDRFMNWIVLNDPYNFGFGLTITFVMLGIIFTNEKALQWFFKDKYLLKHVGSFVALTVGNFFLGKVIEQQGYDKYTFLLGLATIWMVLQSVRLYSGSRKFATKLESKWTQRYSLFRYILAAIAPYVILGILVTIMWIFRYYIVLFTLDVLGPSVPDASFDIYTLEMSFVMPIGYISLIAIFVFIIINGFLTRKYSDTKKASAFDNLTYALISFVMFLFVIYNILLYLFLNETMINGISDALGSTGNSRTMFIVEFGMTIIFFFWIVNDLRKEFDTGFLFFTNDGFIMFMFGTIMAQTTARLGLIRENIGEITGIAKFLTLDYVMIPILIIIFLGITILIYYMRPRKTSIFLRINEAAIDKHDKSMNTILKFLKREFIRRGKKYKINEQLISQIKAITSLPKGVIWSLIHRLDDKYMDVQILEIENEDGEKDVYLDFIPITERYQNDKKAEGRANKFMRERFNELITSDKRKRIKLYSGKKSSLSSSKQSDLFVQALGIQYGRKIKDEESRKQNEEEQEIILNKAIDKDTKDLVYELIRQEYMRRVKHVSDYEEVRFRISEIARKVEDATKVSPGRLYPLLEQMAVEDWNFNLSAKIEDKKTEEDKLIEFLPIDDFEIYELLEKYRPNMNKEVNILMQTWFERNIKYKRTKLEKIPRETYLDEDAEFERSYRSKWFAQTMKYFANNFQKRKLIELPHLRSKKFEKAIRKIIKAKLKDYEKLKKRKKDLPEYSY